MGKNHGKATCCIVLTLLILGQALSGASNALQCGRPPVPGRRGSQGEEACPTQFVASILSAIGSLCSITVIFIACQLRQYIRQKLRINDSGIMDFFYSCCCTPCSETQMMVQLDIESACDLTWPQQHPAMAVPGGNGQFHSNVNSTIAPMPQQQPVSTVPQVVVAQPAQQVKA